MIRSATIKTGWASKLEAIKGRLFEFTPNVNIVFGPNGCGKTSLLRILGAYCGCKNFGGWSGFVKPGHLKKLSYPQVFSKLSPGKCEADIEWDGLATLLHMAHRPDEGIVGGNMLNNMAEVSIQLSRMSTGQERLQRISKLCNKLQDPPDHFIVPDEVSKANDLWKNAAEEFVKYIQSLKREDGSPITCLLDEPTRSMDIITTMAFWRSVLPKLGNIQLIIATHCPILLMMENNYHFIDMREGYLKKANEFLVAGINGEELPKTGGWW